MGDLLHSFFYKMQKLTDLQVLDKATEYMKEKGVDFGSREANESAEEMFLNGSRLYQKLYEELLTRFKQEHIEQYKQRAHESAEQSKRIIELEMELKQLKDQSNNQKIIV